MSSSASYHITNTMTCKKETVGGTTRYGLSVYGMDTTSKYYVSVHTYLHTQVHNVISHQSITGDFVLETKTLVASKSLAEQEKYPWEGTIY